MAGNVDNNDNKYNDKIMLEVIVVNVPSHIPCELVGNHDLNWYHPHHIKHTD